jgi:hypothetical protein
MVERPEENLPKEALNEEVRLEPENLQKRLERLRTLLLSEIGPPPF